jgi:undecaprenyl-diphosphatase
VSAFGSLPACAAVIGVTAVLLAIRRRPAELIVLVVGFALIYVAVHVAKDAIDRPRPAGPLIDTSLSSFPSGHAAYATAWIATALVFTRRLGLVGQASLVTGTIVLAAAIGLSRIYLRAHYWSDVAAGWGVGVGIFATLAALALLIQYMRHNYRGRVGPPEQPAVARAQR